MYRLTPILTAFLLALLPAGPVAAQGLGQVVSQILVIDRDVLFSQTLYGKRVSDALEAESDALAEETRKIEAALEEEEQSLTEKRATLSVEEFRALADDFDARVVALRTDRDQAQANFVQRFETAQRDFFTQIGPILGRLMQERGAVVLLDKRSVLLSANSVDVTSAAVARIDETLGDGTSETEGSPE